jgi:hypothetical protein
MSTPEQPETPPLTRRQLREIRNTGATPIIDPDAIVAVLDDQVAVEPEESTSEPSPAEAPPVAPPPPFEASLAPISSLARPAEPIVLPEPPGPDHDVDLGVAPLTRRQARQQERIRTASVPVITPDIAAAFAAQSATDAAPAAFEHSAPSESGPADSVEESAVLVGETDGDGFAELGVSSGSLPIAEQSSDEGSADDRVEELIEVAGETEEPARVVDPGFGAALLAGDVSSVGSFAPSFDELITRSSNGSVATPNALILTQSPNGGSIVSPVAATGEVIITGTFNLPEGLGSTGHAPGTADGKEVDAVLVDGELPAHSSPTPIAASAAISTVKSPGEIIKPPAPEKGGRLMLTLAITAGALALALVGVLILAFATGVF